MFCLFAIFLWDVFNHLVGFLIVQHLACTYYILFSSHIKTKQTLQTICQNIMINVIYKSPDIVGSCMFCKTHKILIKNMNWHYELLFKVQCYLREITLTAQSEEKSGEIEGEQTCTDNHHYSSSKTQRGKPSYSLSISPSTHFPLSVLSLPVSWIAIQHFKRSQDRVRLTGLSSHQLPTNRGLEHKTGWKEEAGGLNSIQWALSASLQM